MSWNWYGWLQESLDYSWLFLAETANALSKRVGEK